MEVEMTAFVFTELVPTENESAALGVNAAGKFTDKDLGKPVKFGAANNYVLAAAGNDIDGFVLSVEPFTVNDGVGFGGVMRKGRITVEVGANQGGTPMAVGDYVVADAQAAVGTAGTAKVKTGVAFAQSGTTPFAITRETPLHAMWRCIRIISGTGVAGDSVLLERL
jgi:hypothetical protein